MYKSPSWGSVERCPPPQWDAREAGGCRLCWGTRGGRMGTGRLEPAPAGPGGPAPLSSKLLLAGGTDAAIQGRLTRETRLHRPRLPQAALRAAESSGMAGVCHFLDLVGAFVKMTTGLQRTGLGSRSLTGHDVLRHDGPCGQTP